MNTAHKTPSGYMSHEERAFFARLAAMNTLFESARAGDSARGFAVHAQSCDAVLTAFLDELKLKSI